MLRLGKGTHCACLTSAWSTCTCLTPACTCLTSAVPLRLHAEPSPWKFHTRLRPWPLPLAACWELPLWLRAGIQDLVRGLVVVIVRVNRDGHHDSRRMAWRKRTTALRRNRVRPLRHDCAGWEPQAWQGRTSWEPQKRQSSNQAGTARHLISNDPLQTNHSVSATATRSSTWVTSDFSAAFASTCACQEDDSACYAELLQKSTPEHHLCRQTFCGWPNCDQ